MYNSQWYDNLIQPHLSPPDWLFAPVWIILYISIFISLILFIVSNKYLNKVNGYIYFSAQMILNLLWSPAFFIFKNIVLALIIVILMDIFIFLTIKEFYRVSKIAGLILVPYLLWTLFATYLNFGYLILN